MINLRTITRFRQAPINVSAKSCDFFGAVYFLGRDWTPTKPWKKPSDHGPHETRGSKTSLPTHQSTSSFFFLQVSPKQFTFSNLMQHLPTSKLEAPKLPLFFLGWHLHDLHKTLEHLSSTKSKLPYMNMMILTLQTLWSSTCSKYNCWHYQIQSFWNLPRSNESHSEDGPIKPILVELWKEDDQLMFGKRKCLGHFGGLHSLNQYSPW